LNVDYKLQQDLNKIERELERKLHSPHLKINKGQVLSNLKRTFFNNTFLIRQKRLKEEVDKNMIMLGIDLEPYKLQAKQIIRRDQYKKNSVNLPKIARSHSPSIRLSMTSTSDDPFRRDDYRRTPRKEVFN
jgi:hypothetical protein